MKKTSWLVAAIFSLAAISPAQSNPSLIPRTSSEREAQQKTNNRIFLNVLVTDAAGRPVPGLTREDFTLLDDRQPHKIDMFREFDGRTRPAHIFIVLDAINSDESTIAHFRSDLAHYLSRSQNPLPYPVSLVLITNGEQTAKPPSADRAVLKQYLAQIPKNAHSSDCDQASFTPDCFYERLEQSTTALSKLLKEQATMQGRIVLLWTGPGWPLAKHLSGNYRDLLVGLITDLGVAQTTLYAASPGAFNQPIDGPRQPPGEVDAVAVFQEPSQPDKAAQQNLTLPMLARESGGRTFEKTDLGKVLDTCFADTSRYYLNLV
jgi:VWFA-related protein